jgi:hypothetical protein
VKKICAFVSALVALDRNMSIRLQQKKNGADVYTNIQRHFFYSPQSIHCNAE